MRFFLLLGLIAACNAAIQFSKATTDLKTRSCAVGCECVMNFEVEGTKSSVAFSLEGGETKWLTGRERAKRVLKFNPTLDHIGDHTLCVKAGVTGGGGADRRLLNIANHCVKVTVPRCRVCVGARDTLQSLAREYDTDWLQLWGANPDLENPDHVASGSDLNLGPIYKVKNHDTLDLLSERFGTSVRNILSVNPDVDPKGPLNIGAELCLLPSVYASSYTTHEYGAA